MRGVILAALMVACGSSGSGPVDASLDVSADLEAGVLCSSDLATPDQSCGTLSWTTSATKSRKRNHHVTYITHAQDGSAFLVAAAGGDKGVGACNTDIAPIARDGSVGAFSAGPDYGACVGGLTGTNVSGVLVGAGGKAASLTVSEVFTSVVQPDGSLAPWKKQAFMNEARMHAASFAVGSRMWILGGFADSNVWSDAIFADVGSDGTIAAWSSAGNLPGPLTHFSIAYARGHVYTAGGLDQLPTVNPAMHKDVLRGTVEQDGTIDGWVPMNSLPAGVCTHSSFVYGGYLYVAGGIDDTPAQLATVRRAAIQSDMTLAAWEDVAALPIARGHVHQLPVEGTHVYSVSGAINFSLDSTDAVFVGSFL